MAKNSNDIEFDFANASPKAIIDYAEVLYQACSALNYQIGRLSTMLSDFSLSDAARMDIATDSYELVSAVGLINQKRQAFLELLKSSTTSVPKSNILSEVQTAIDALNKVTLKSNTAKKALNFAIAAVAGGASILTGEVVPVPASAPVEHA